MSGFQGGKPSSNRVDLRVVSVVDPQSRALCIARPFRQVRILVAMSGFHISRCLSTLDGHELDTATFTAGLLFQDTEAKRKSFRAAASVTPSRVGIRYRPWPGK